MVFLLRAIGFHPALAEYDSSLRQAFEIITGEVTEDAWKQVCLPFSLGGFGLREASPIASIALAASAITSTKLISTLFRSGPPPPDTVVSEALAADPMFATLPHREEISDALRHHGFEVPDLETPVSAVATAGSIQEAAEMVEAEAVAAIASVPAAAEREDSSSPKLQRIWTRKAERTRFETICSEASDGGKRLKAFTASHSSGWLIGASEDEQSSETAFSPSEWLVLARLRLGLPLTERAIPCNICRGRALADEFGDHSLKCMFAGCRTRLSNDVRDEVIALIRAAGYTVSREVRPYPTAPRARVDFLATVRGETFSADIAVTHSYLGDPDTYATKVKVARYGEANAETEGISLVPMVVDTAGRWCQSAIPLLRRAAVVWGHRHDMRPARAIPLAFARVNRVLMRGLARILLLNLAPDSDPQTGWRVVGAAKTMEPLAVADEVE